MGVIVLGLSDRIRLEEKQSRVAGVIKRELAAASGMSVTALDIPAGGDGLFEELSRALRECDVLLTIGGLDRPGYPHPGAGAGGPDHPGNAGCRPGLV